MDGFEEGDIFLENVFIGEVDDHFVIEVSEADEFFAGTIVYGLNAGVAEALVEFLEVGIMELVKNDVTFPELVPAEFGLCFSKDFLPDFFEKSRPNSAATNSG